MNEREDEPPRQTIDSPSELGARKVERANFKAKTRTPITLVLDGVLGNYLGRSSDLPMLFCWRHFTFAGRPWSHGTDALPNLRAAPSNGSPIPAAKTSQVC